MLLRDPVDAPHPEKQGHDRLERVRCSDNEPAVLAHEAGLVGQFREGRGHLAQILFRQEDGLEFVGGKFVYQIAKNYEQVVIDNQFNDDTPEEVLPLVQRRRSGLGFRGGRLLRLGRYLPDGYGF